MINVIASIKVKESCLDAFLEVLAPQLLDSRTVTIIEKWQSIENLRAHFVAPHMLAYKSEVADLVESVSLKVLEDA